MVRQTFGTGNEAEGGSSFPSLGCFDKARVCVKSMFNDPADLKWRAVSVINRPI
jgi:hypothetical protein